MTKSLSHRLWVVNTTVAEWCSVLNVVTNSSHAVCVTMSVNLTKSTDFRPRQWSAWYSVRSALTFGLVLPFLWCPKMRICRRSSLIVFIVVQNCSKGSQVLCELYDGSLTVLLWYLQVMDWRSWQTNLSLQQMRPLSRWTRAGYYFLLSNQIRFPI